MYRTRVPMPKFFNFTKIIKNYIRENQKIQKKKIQDNSQYLKYEGFLSVGHV